MQVSDRKIVFVACHGGPADHFAVFAEHYEKDGYEVKIYASGSAIKKIVKKSLTAKIFTKKEGLELLKTGDIKIL